MKAVDNNTLWNLYKQKKKDLLYYGITHGLIKRYDEDLLSKLREVYYGGIPASIILLYKGLCSGFCFDRAVLIAHAFEYDDYKLVYAHVDAIGLDPKNQELMKKDKDTDIHCYVERTLENGEVWVYDTTLGFCIEKTLYDQMENPVVTHTNSKEKTIAFFEYQEILNRDETKDRYTPLLMLPMIEGSLEEIKYVNNDLLKREIELFKEKINYEELEKEFDKKLEEHNCIEVDDLCDQILGRKL